MTNQKLYDCYLHEVNLKSGFSAKSYTSHESDLVLLQYSLILRLYVIIYMYRARVHLMIMSMFILCLVWYYLAFLLMDEVWIKALVFGIVILVGWYNSMIMYICCTHNTTRCLYCLACDFSSFFFTSICSLTFKTNGYHFSI